MRAAPPARAWSRSAGPWLGLQQLLFAVSAAVAACWAGAHLALPGPPVLVVSAALGWAVAAVVRRWLAEPPRLLAWDGATWSLGADGDAAIPGQPEPMLDLGDWMLVRFVFFQRQGAAPWRRARWLPLSRRDAGPAWPALRMALYHDRPAVGPGPAA